MRLRLILGAAAVLGLSSALLPGATGSAAPAPAPGTISTLAGGDAPGPDPATNVAMSPAGVAAVGQNLYVGSGSVVRLVAGDGTQTVVAGDGTFGYSGDGSAATSAELYAPFGVAVDLSGNLVIADDSNDRVRVVAATSGMFYGQAMTAGDIYTVAGDGTYGYSGDDGPATSAELSAPTDVAVDDSGNLVIADTEHDIVRMVAVTSGTFYRQAMTAGDIYTVAGDGSYGYSGDNGPATAAHLTQPAGVTVDGIGNLVIADTDNDAVRVVAAISGTFYGQAMTAGDIYTVAGNGTFGYSGDGGRATSAQLYHPFGVAVDNAGNVVMADSDNNRVRVVAVTSGTFYRQAMKAGDIYTVAGKRTRGPFRSGVPATAGRLSKPLGVAVDGAGNLIIADGSNRLRAVAASRGTYYGQVMKGGDLYTVGGDGTDLYSGDGGPANLAELFQPHDVAVDGDGNLVIADARNNCVRVVAATGGTFYGRAMVADDIYTVAGTGAVGYSGNGRRATSAELNSPYGVAVDGAGNLIIADTFNNRVRVVAARRGTFYGRAMKADHIYTVAGDGGEDYSGDGKPATTTNVYFPSSVAVDHSGNLVIADSFNSRLRVVAARHGTFYGQSMTTGDIYTVAGNGTLGYSGDGGPATSAEIANPQGVAVDQSGNLVIADFTNRIRVVATTTGTFYGQAMTAGDIDTVAGDGDSTFVGDGGPATSAAVDAPNGVTVDGAGNLVIADSDNNRVRVVAAVSGTFYGRAMVADDIYTVAGNGTQGYSGDGGPATSAELSSPSGVAVDGLGNVFIADQINGRIREVAATG